MSHELQKTPPVIHQLSPHKRPALANIIPAFSDEPEPKPEHSLVVVAEAEGRIVTTITAERVWCVSNLYCEAAYRGSGAPEEVARTIAALNTEGLTEMLCTTSRHVELLAHRFGFVPVRGTLFRR